MEQFVPAACGITVAGIDTRISMKLTNNGKSILPAIIAVLTAAALLLLWQSAYPTPASMLLFGFLALSFLNYAVGGRDVLYPAFTFTAIWAAVTIVYIFCPVEIRPIGWKTVGILVGGATSFSIGCLFGSRRLLGMGYADKHLDSRDNPQARLLLLGYSVLTVPIVIFDVQQIVGERISLSPAFFIKLRTTINYLYLSDPGTSPYGGWLMNRIVTTSFIISVLTFLLFVMEEKRKWAIVSCASCLILLSLLFTGRTFLMQAFCGSVCLILLRRKTRKFTDIALPIGIAGFGLILVMAAITFLTKSETQGANGLQVATDMTFEYIAGPIAGFDYAIDHPAEFRDQPATVFAGVLTPLSRLELIRYKPPSASDDFVYVPFPTNVYTCFKPYYEDFGATGCFLALAIFGFVEGCLFHAAIRGGHISAFVLAYLSDPLMFSTFDDHYRYMMGYIYLGLYIYVYFYYLKRVRINVMRSVPIAGVGIPGMRAT